MKRFKKVLKIAAIVLGILLILLFIAAHVLMRPASDENVLKELTSTFTKPTLYYNNYKSFSYRVVRMQTGIDSTLPTLVFVHGSPGSLLDYKRYLTDSLLNKKANMVAYDRVGYGLKNTGQVQGTLAFELAILDDVIQGIPDEKIVLAGYSYGGPVVLASNKNYKYKVSMASAVVGAYEPMFWLLNFYKWRLTRPLIPAKLRAAAKEKYAHLEDLPNYKDKWNLSPSKIINIQGEDDAIVPYKNSEFLTRVIDSSKFTMVTIKGGGHDLIWTNFELIKSEILKTLD
tara:strand:- start:182687 stop:183544 length:858 start_codon:yes stop_codon:yes gene_type:complete